MRFDDFKFFLIVLAAYPYSLIGLLDSLAVSGNPSTLTINTAIAGQQPTSATDSSTTYSVSTLSLVRSISGALNASMPSGLTLKVTLAAPMGGTSQGAVTLTTTSKTLVSNVTVLALQSGIGITYTLSATVNAAKVTNSSKVLTLTLQ